MSTIKPKLALFDLDGTLVRFPKEFLFLQVEEVLARLELPAVERHLLEDAFADFDFFRWVAPGIRETFMDTYWELFDWERYPKPLIIPGALDALKSIKDGGTDIGIVTSRHESEEAIRSDLESTELLPYVSFIIPRGGDDKHWSDKTFQIRQACRNTGIEPADTLLVGDVPPDISSARIVGVGKTAAVLTGGIRREILEKSNPDFILNDVGELNTIFVD